MKLKELIHVRESIALLFNHFYENSIHPLLDSRDDYNALFNTLMEAEYLGYSYIEPIHTYSIDFMVEDSKWNGDYMFKYDSSDSFSKNMVHVDFDGGGFFSSLIIDIESTRHLPFVSDLVDGDGIMAVEYLPDCEKSVEVLPEDVMAVEEFGDSLRRCFHDRRCLEFAVG